MQYVRFMTGVGCVLALVFPGVKPAWAQAETWWAAGSPDQVAARWIDLSRTNAITAAEQCLELLQARQEARNSQARIAWLTLVGQAEFGRRLAKVSPELDLAEWLRALPPLEPGLEEVLFEFVSNRSHATEVRRRAALALKTTAVLVHRKFLLDRVTLDEAEDPAVRTAAAEALLGGPKLSGTTWEPLRRAFRQANTPALQTGLLALFPWIDHPEGISQLIEEATRQGGGGLIREAALHALLKAARQAAEQRDRDRIEPLGRAASQLYNSTDPVEQAAGLGAMRWTDPAAFARIWNLVRDDPAAWRRFATDAEPRRWWLHDLVLAGDLLDRTAGESELRAVRWLPTLEPAPLSQGDLMHALFEINPGWLFEATTGSLRSPAQRANREAGIRLAAALPGTDADRRSWEVWKTSARSLAEWWALPEQDELWAGVLRRGLQESMAVRAFEEAVLEICAEEPALRKWLNGARRKALQEERSSAE